MLQHISSEVIIFFVADKFKVKQYNSLYGLLMMYVVTYETLSLLKVMQFKQMFVIAVCTCDVSGGVFFFAFEAIVCSAGFHLKFLASRSCEVWSQRPKSLKPPRNVIRQHRLGLLDWVRGFWLSVLSRRIEVTPSRRGIESLSECVWINLLYIPMNQWLMKRCKKKMKRNKENQKL